MTWEQIVSTGVGFLFPHHGTFFGTDTDLSSLVAPALLARDNKKMLWPPLDPFGETPLLVIHQCRGTCFLCIPGLDVMSCSLTPQQCRFLTTQAPEPVLSDRKILWSVSPLGRPTNEVSAPLSFSKMLEWFKVIGENVPKDYICFAPIFNFAAASLYNIAPEQRKAAVVIILNIRN